MSSALIGHSGFVGGNLLAKRSYDSIYRSTDVSSIRRRSFEHVVCAGVQAMKWWANLHPDEDRAGILSLQESLAAVQARRFTLISTIDIYPTPSGVDEDTPINSEGHHVYGLHRLEFENWVRQHFSKALILRLPGLFGPGIKKNVIFDMLHKNGIEKIHPGGIFQYYDLRRLADDIDRAWALKIPTLNISSEPLGTANIRDRFFPDIELGSSSPPPAAYDMRSKYADIWGGADGYLYPKKAVLSDLEEWLKTVR